MSVRTACFEHVIACSWPVLDTSAVACLSLCLPSRVLTALIPAADVLPAVHPVARRVDCAHLYRTPRLSHCWYMKHLGCLNCIQNQMESTPIRLYALCGTNSLHNPEPDDINVKRCCCTTWQQQLAQGLLCTALQYTAPPASRFYGQAGHDRPALGTEMLDRVGLPSMYTPPRPCLHQCIQPLLHHTCTPKTR